MEKDGIFEVWYFWSSHMSYACMNLEIMYHVCVSQIDVSLVASWRMVLANLLDNVIVIAK